MYHHQESLYDCCSCEDQYLKQLSGMGRFQKEGVLDSWICQRCDEAQKSTLMVALGGGGKDKDATINHNNHNGKLFVPCPELAKGWCHTKKAKKDPKTTPSIYLSPLGYELESKEDAVAHQIFEQVND